MGEMADMILEQMIDWDMMDRDLPIKSNIEWGAYFEDQRNYDELNAKRMSLEEVIKRSKLNARKPNNS